MKDFKFRITWKNGSENEFTLTDVVTKSYYDALVKIALKSEVNIEIIEEIK